MPRTRHAVSSRARRKRILKEAKGYWGRRKNVWKVAKNAVEKGWTYAYMGRKQKKRAFRRLWILRINAAARSHGLTYSVFLDKLSKNNCHLNRKALADLAMNEPEAFEALVKKVA